jgi:hypothetical protein
MDGLNELEARRIAFEGADYRPMARSPKISSRVWAFFSEDSTKLTAAII